MNPIVLIPARMAASRLPGKPLADIAGRAMILRALDCALEADVGPVAVAAGDPEIFEAVLTAGGQAVMTDPDLPSGSDRILAALRHRERSGAGQRVEVDLLSSLLAALANQGSAYTVAGVVGARMGNAHPSIAPYDLYATAEGELVLAVGNDRQFRSLCEVLGASHLAADPRFATNAERVASRVSLRAELEQRLAARGAADWVELLTPSGVPAGQVNDIAGAFACAEGLGLEPIASIPKPAGGTVELTRNPIGLSATPATYREAPPRMPECEANHGAEEKGSLW